MKTTFKWKTHQTAVPTDHWMVSTKYAPTHAPYIGTGQWALQTHKLKNNDMMGPIVKRGITLQSELNRLKIEQIPCGIENPQMLWNKFKQDARVSAKKHCKEL